MSILKHVFTITYELSVDSDSGEIMSTKIIDKSDIKPTKKEVVKVEDGGEEPKLYLEDNKYRLNLAAISLMGLDSTSKLVIKYEDSKPQPIPVIGTNTAFGVSSGNKLSKTNTVACRGSNREELAKYGESFTVAPHPSKKDLFILVSDNPPVIEESSTEEINTEVNENLPFDLNLDNEVSNTVTEIDVNFFKL